MLEKQQVTKYLVNSTNVAVCASLEQRGQEAGKVREVMRWDLIWVVGAGKIRQKQKGCTGRLPAPPAAQATLEVGQQ